MTKKPYAAPYTECQGTYSPLASRVKDSITEHETTAPAHEVTTAKLFDDVRIHVSAIWTDEAYSKVRAVRRLLGLLCGRSERKGLCKCHVRGAVGSR